MSAAMAGAKQPKIKSASHDPANPDNANSNHTKKDGTKPVSAVSAIFDPEFIPTLDEGTPPFRYLQSFSILGGLIVGAFFVAYFANLDVFQTTTQMVIVSGSVVLSLLYTGVVWIDFWELVVGYWWLSVPAAGAAGLLFIMMEESEAAVEMVA